MTEILPNPNVDLNNARNLPRDEPLRPKRDVREEAWVVTIPVRVQITATVGYSPEKKKQMAQDAARRLKCDVWVYQEAGLYKLKSVPPTT